MTDEKLNQILQQALTSDVQDEDIHIYKKVRKNKMKNILKAGIAVAACAALVLTLNINEIFWGNATNNNEQSGVKAEVTNNNPFVLTCFAAELDEGVQVPVSLAGDVYYGSGLCGGEDGNTVSYVIGAKFACEGEGIDSITYHINKGAFCVTELKGASIMTDYTDYNGPELNTPAIVFDHAGMDESEAKYEKHCVSEYTVSYDRQFSDTTIITICGEKTDTAIYHAIFDDIPIEQEVDGYTSLMEGVEITCTVTYTDGTTDSKVIVVKGCIEKDAEKGGEDGTYESVDFAYELK